MKENSNYNFENKQPKKNNKPKSLSELEIEIKFYNTKLQKLVEEAAALREKEEAERKLQLEQSRTVRRADIESALDKTNNMIKSYLEDYGELSINTPLYYLRTVFGRRPMQF